MRYKFIKSQEEAYEILREMEFEESLRNFPDSLKVSEDEFWDLITDNVEERPLYEKDSNDFSMKYIGWMSSKYLKKK